MKNKRKDTIITAVVFRWRRLKRTLFRKYLLRSKYMLYLTKGPFLKWTLKSCGDEKWDYLRHLTATCKWDVLLVAKRTLAVNELLAYVFAKWRSSMHMLLSPLSSDDLMCKVANLQRDSMLWSPYLLLDWYTAKWITFAFSSSAEVFYGWILPFVI